MGNAILVGLSSFAAITILASGQQSMTCSEDNRAVVEEIGNILMNYVTTTSDINESKLEELFHHFDSINSDGFWSKDEFGQYLACLMDINEFHNQMNYGNDAVLSFREIVSYLLHLKGPLKENVRNIAYDAIKDIYGYEDTDGPQKFCEYLGDSLLKKVDKRAEGIIYADDLVNEMINWYFNQYDSVNSDGLIDFIEFMETTFNTHAINTVLSYLDDNYNFNYSKDDFFLPYNKDEELSLKFDTCPSSYTDPSYLNENQERRRLGNIFGCIFGSIGSAACWGGLEEISMGAATAGCVAATGGTIASCS